MKQRTDKELSVEHENYIAEAYDGKRSKSSGAAAHDDGDVRNDTELFECKVTRKAMPAKLRNEFEKITNEAWAEGRTPAYCTRYYEPTSILANPDGWVDFTIRLTEDDRDRYILVFG